MASVRNVMCVTGCVLAPVFGACREQPTDRGPDVLLAPEVATVSSGMEPFVMELDSGRAVITMMGLHAAQIQDVKAARIDTIGRGGGGPGEFSRAGRIMPWSSGRFAVIDPVEMRITLFSAAGGLDTTLLMPRTMDLRFGIPHDDGHVWFTAGAPRKGADSVPLLRLTVSSNHIDTLTFLLTPEATFTPMGDIAMWLTPEYAARDVWGVAPNGRVWIARGADNRVDWIDTSGAMTRGKPLPFTTIRTVEADRLRVKGLPAAPILDTLHRAMASTKAPFQDAVLGPDDELWVWRNQLAGTPYEVYDVLRRDGTVRAHIKAPPAHRLLAVGSEFVYLYGEDADGDLVITTHVRPTLR